MNPTDASPAGALERLNAAAPAAFVEALADIVEHSPWVAEAVVSQRPFASVGALHAAMLDAIVRAPREARVALACLHPELAGREASDGTLTEASSAEQARLGLTALSAADHARLTALNRRYRETFGFPFITAVRLHPDLVSIFDALERRCRHDRDVELEETVRQIGEVMRGRLARRFGLVPEEVRSDASASTAPAGHGRPSAPARAA